MRISIYLTHPTVSCWNFSEIHRRRLEACLPGVEISRLETEDEFIRSLAHAEIAVVWTFEEEWINLALNLKWIVTPAAGRDYFSVAADQGLDIDYGSFHGPLIAETVLGMLLGHCRGLFLAERLLPDRPWPRAELSRSMRRLLGARLTILGFGAIGRCIGRLAKPFGVLITGISRRRGERPEYFGAKDSVLSIHELDGALRETDFLILTLPRTRETDRILDARRLALLPPNAIVVNVGRGNAIDEEALAAALVAKNLAGAYLDVYSKEPLPDSSPLRQAPNVLLLPHASAIAPEYLDLFIDEFVGKFEKRYGRASAS